MAIASMMTIIILRVKTLMMYIIKVQSTTGTSPATPPRTPMKITKAQAEANRARVVETASRLFREHGFDGVGVADLMAAAGFTHGGFYKQFGSKADLMAEATARGIGETVALASGVDASEFVSHYLSSLHRDGRATGCTMAALSGDAARQPEPVRIAFEEGVETLLALLSPASRSSDPAAAARARAQVLGVLAHAVGALVLSRACPDDSGLADEILTAGRDAILGSQSPAPPQKAKNRRRKPG
jgi:TetR/AcrR family transcriptional regulator, transcriptional repressor for nem operon